MNCKVVDCNDNHEARGYCHNHYQQWRRNNADKCLINDCEKPGTKRKMCHGHYEKWRISNNSVCNVDGCLNARSSRGMCKKHYEVWRKKNGPRCKIENCDAHRVANGLCNAHYSQIRRTNRPECNVEGCLEKSDTWNMCRRHYRLQKKYNLNQIQLDDLMTYQNGVCAICGIAAKAGITTNSNELHIDHCHESRRVRGLLCNSCNAALGHFRDNTSVLMKAIEYLQSPPAFKVHSIRTALEA